ncbi:hypothetical protein DY000_02060404 [Brassica cretica]|uniref:Uncharacterized protein n=1 Tax=Brassica cretica TaxID=69181 RepID=A0ABQ7AXY4_BRACR|nr:hypothetical protein DY000_02060404 [Brassica cretica]
MVGNASRVFDQRSQNWHRRGGLAYLHIGISLVTMGRRHVKNKRFGAREVLKETRVIGQELEKGRYVATELEPKLGRSERPSVRSLGRYVATERSSARSLRSDRARAEARSLRCDRARAGVWSLRSDRALSKRRYDISPYILVYPSMLFPEDRSEPVSRSLPF